MKLYPSPKTKTASFWKSGLVLSCVLLINHNASATLLEYWDFNNVTSTYTNPTLGKFTTPITGPSTPAANNNGEIYDATTKLLSSNAGGFTGGPVFTNGSINFNNYAGAANQGNNASFNWGAFADAGSSGHSAASDPSTGKGSLGIFVNSSSLPDPANTTLTMNLSSTGYQNLTLNFDARRANPSNTAVPISWFYSIDGGSDIAISSSAISFTSSQGGFTPYALTLPTALSNLDNFQLKAVFNFQTPNVGTSFAIDNLELNGVAVPEPKAAMLLGLGGIVLLFGRRFRSRLS
jgi:hypothetical protein